MQKRIATFSVGHDRQGGLDVEEMRKFVKAADENPDAIIEYDHERSDHESTFWHLINPECLYDHRNLTIIDKDRKLAGALHKRLKRTSTEDVNTWRRRVDIALRDGGYYIERGIPEWVLLLDVEHKIKGVHIFIDGQKAFPIYRWIPPSERDEDY